VRPRTFRALLLVATAAALIPAPALAQQPAAARSIDGRVVLGELGVAGTRVELHRVTRDSAGVSATATTRADGGFDFTVPPPDSAGFTVYFATADYLGVRYFGPPLHPTDASAAYRIEVFDTVEVSEAPSAVRLVSRDIVLMPQGDGGWEINEIVQLVNPEKHTFVAPFGVPTWEFRIPAEADAFEVGEGETADREVIRMGERVLLTAPVVPGARELFLRYRVPASRKPLEYALTQPAESFTVFVRQPAPIVAVQGLATSDSVSADGERFLRYSGSELAAGTTVRIESRGPKPAPVKPVHAAIAMVALVLAGGSFAAARRRPAQA
jgi:hypothetical protein